MTQHLATGRRVRYVGLTGRDDGPTGRVSRVLKAAVRVRWDDGRIEDVHPESLSVLSGSTADQLRTVTRQTP